MLNLNNAVLALKQVGFWVIGLDSNATLPLEEANPDILKKVALVFDSEGKGISALRKTNCDQTYKIKIKDGPINRLNVANAAAIAFFAISQQQAIK